MTAQEPSSSADAARHAKLLTLRAITVGIVAGIIASIVAGLLVGPTGYIVGFVAGMLTGFGTTKTMDRARNEAEDQRV